MTRITCTLLLLTAFSCMWTAAAPAQSPPVFQLEAQLVASGLEFPTWAGSPPVVVPYSAHSCCPGHYRYRVICGFAAHSALRSLHGGIKMPSVHRRH